MTAFLANENFPLPSVYVLRGRSLSVDAVVESASGTSDRLVLEQAALHQQIILTFDRDYGELIYKYQLPVPAGVIYFRFVPADPAPRGTRSLFLRVIYSG